MNEISGILKNGIDRGWQLEEIKQSLLNSGCTLKEIESEILSFQAKPISTQEQPVQEQKYNSQNLTNYQTPSIEQKKSSSPILVYIMAFLLGLILVGALVFFLKF